MNTGVFIGIMLFFIVCGIAEGLDLWFLSRLELETSYLVLKLAPVLSGSREFPAAETSRLLNPFSAKLPGIATG